MFHASILAPNAQEKLSRALGDLRLGLPCLVQNGADRIVVVATEPLTNARFEALQSLCGVPELVLTANRARAVMAPSQSADVDDDPVRLHAPRTADLQWYKRQSDCGLDSGNGPVAPLHRVRGGDDKLHRLAIRLVKKAELLPSALCFALPAGALPANVDMNDIEYEAAMLELTAEPVLAPVAAAALPVEAHDCGKLHVLRGLDGVTEHYAFEVGTPNPKLPVLTRLHSACFTGDVLGSLKCDCGPQLRTALRRMGEEGGGILLYLNQEGRGIGLANKMRVYDLQARGYDTVDANHKLGYADDERDFRLAAVMLRRLGYGAVRLLTNNPAKVQAFEAHGIAVAERLPLRVGENEHNKHYLAVKALKSGHAL